MQGAPVLSGATRSITVEGASEDCVDAGGQMDAAQSSLFLGSFAGDNPTLRRLRRIVGVHPPSSVRVVDSVAAADIALYVENGYAGIREALRARRDIGRKMPCFVFSESDWPYPFLPGLYPSLTRRRPWAASWAYILPPAQAAADDAGDDRRYLFSFVGRASTHKVRETVLCLDTPDTPCIDASAAGGRFPGWDYRRSFDQLIRESRFVLCPRGIGASSIRVFEAMRAGRVPVIVSDAWLEPPVGDWTRFSLRIPEARVVDIPAVCRAYEGRAAEMGRAAREAYHTYFAPERFIDSVIAQMLVLEGYARPRLAMAAAALTLRDLRAAARSLRGG